MTIWHYDTVSLWHCDTMTLWRYDTLTYHCWGPVMVQCCRDWVCCQPGERGGGPGAPPPPPPPHHHPGYLNMRGQVTPLPLGCRSDWLTSQHPLCHWSAVLSPDDNVSPAPAHLTWKGNDIYQSSVRVWSVEPDWGGKLIKYLEVNDEAGMMVMGGELWLAGYQLLSLLPPPSSLLPRTTALPWDRAEFHNNQLDSNNNV